MIDKVIVLNLPSYPHRKHMSMGMLAGQGWRKDRIKIWTAKNGLHFGEAPDPPLTANVMLAAIADGFDCFRGVLKSRQSEGGLVYDDIHMVAQQWNYFRILRWIMDEGVTALVLHDDVVPRWGYEDLKTRCELLKYRYKKMDFLSLWWFISHQKKRLRLNENPRKTVVAGIVEGIMGPGDKANVISPDGAKWLYDSMCEDYWTGFSPSVEVMIERTAVKGNVPRGVFSLDIHRRTGCVEPWALSDSAIMTYHDGDSKFKVDNNMTNRIPDFDWHYYDEVLPKLWHHYQEKKC